MAVATRLDLTATDAEALKAMGFDVDHLRMLQAQLHSKEFRLERMGFDVEQLRFYAWLVKNGRNPEYSCRYPDPAPAAKAVSHGR